MKKTFFFYLFLSFIYGFSQKKGDFNNFVHLSSAQGLSQNSVFAFEQDDLGQMWIGTRDGLNKHDGEKITVYRNIIGDTTSITNNYIRCLEKDDKGFLWVGTQKGLNYYNPKKNTFRNFTHSSEDAYSISDNTITAITKMKNGDLWVGTINGLSIYNYKKGKFTNYTNNYIDQQTISNNYVTEIYQDKLGTIWVATIDGLNKAIQDIDRKITFKRFYFDKGAEVKKNTIQTIERSADNNLWIGTKDHGVLVFNTSENVFTKPKSSILKGLTSKDIRSFSYDNNNNLWVATYDGLFIIANNESVFHITNQYGNQKSLSRNTLKKIFTDSSGTIWIGAYHGGVNIWDGYNNNFDKVLKIESDKAYPLGVVSSIQEDKEGNLYFGTEGEGITVINKHKTTNNNLTRALNKELAGVNVKSLLIDENKLWIGTFNKGVKCFDLQLNRFIDYIKYNDSIVEILKNAHVYSIVRVDELMIFGTFGQGIVVCNLKSNEIDIINSELYKPEMLTNNRIRVLFVDNNKNLWIGTESGLNRIKYLNLVSNKYSVERFLFNTKNYLGSDIATLTQSANGNIYAGTRENGIFVYEGNHFNPVVLKTKNRSVNTICSIVEDNQNNLWISSNYGIVKYNIATENLDLYSQIGGLIGQEFNNNSGKKSSTGEVYFGGIFGASFFDPSLVGKQKKTPKVNLTNLEVQGKEITEFSTEEGVLSQSISYAQKIRLNHNQSSFSLKFASPNFSSISNNKYKYRLVGFDNIWKYSSTPEVNYSIQKPGNFTFEVQTITNTDSAPTSLTIEVMPAPWKNPWAFLIYFIIIALALFALNQIKESRSKLQHRLDLEQIEKEQQQALNKSKLEFFTNISHEFRTPLSLILGPLQQIIEDYQGNNKTYKKLQVIQQNADQLLKLINQLLDFRKFENKHSQLEVAEGNIVKFLKEIYLSFFEFSKMGNYQYTFNTDSDNIQVYFDRYKLERVFYNLISNAFKYTPEGGKIEINISSNSNSVSIEVKDNGKGIDEKYVTKIFDRFYEIASDKKYQKQFNQASGIGLSIAKKAIDLHKGKINVVSSNGHGSTFTVSLFKGKTHLDESDIIENFKISDDVSLYKKQAKLYKSSDFNFDVSNQDKEKPLVLIAEDNDGLRGFIADILKDFYRVVKAENGKVAFKKALQEMPDLIISDVIMPEMEGTELCAKIKTDIRTSHIPLILLTSRTSLIYKFDGLESGADAYINKPFDVKEFLLRVKNLLTTKQKIKEKFSVTSFDLDADSTSSIDDQLLNKAINIVKENIDNTSFNIPHFSAELGVSRTILFAKIKSLTNLTPNEFIHSIRMKRASELLELGQINVSEVCYKVGFRNPKYFTKCFKKHFSQTPSEYASKFYL